MVFFSIDKKEQPGWPVQRSSSTAIVKRPRQLGLTTTAESIRCVTLTITDPSRPKKTPRTQVLEFRQGVRHSQPLPQKRLWRNQPNKPPSSSQIRSRSKMLLFKGLRTLLIGLWMGTFSLTIFLMLVLASTQFPGRGAQATVQDDENLALNDPEESSQTGEDESWVTSADESSLTDFSRHLVIIQYLPVGVPGTNSEATQRSPNGSFSIRESANRPNRAQNSRIQPTEVRQPELQQSGSSSSDGTSSDQGHQPVPNGQQDFTFGYQSSYFNHSRTVPFVARGVHLAQTPPHPDELNIINRIPRVNESRAIQEIALGTYAAGRVVVPMIWLEESAREVNRSNQVVTEQGIVVVEEETELEETEGFADGTFAVELLEDVPAINGEVALPAGTILITRIESASRENNVIQQSVVALLYKDSTGEVVQAEIPPNRILIRGENNTPLVAEATEDKGSTIANQDALVGALSSLARIGEIINLPDEEVIIPPDTGGTVITTTEQNRNIFAAALEGFFDVTSERLRERSDEITSELLARPDVLIVREGTPVTVYFDSYTQVVR